MKLVVCRCKTLVTTKNAIKGKRIKYDEARDVLSITCPTCKSSTMLMKKANRGKR